MDNSQDILGNLRPYYEEDLGADDREKVLELHKSFCNDFIKNKVLLDGKEIKVKPYSYSNASKDSLPEWYDGLNEKFVHIITREIKGNRRKTSRKIREFRSERAQRIHWIKPIIENCNDPRIRRFKSLQDSGRIREYFWFVKGYMVVIEFISSDFALITGFCVDQDNHAYYVKKYQNRLK